MSADSHFGAPEYSSPVVTRQQDGHVTIDWPVRGYKHATVVSDELIDEWIADRNRIVDLEARVAELVDLIGDTE